jgi:hypothetical protein
MEKVVTTMDRTQKKNRNFKYGNLICRSLGVLLLAGIVPAYTRAQNATRVVAPQAHPWATSTTATTQTKVSGTIREISSQHGVTQMVIDGGNGTITADLGPSARSAAKSFGAGDRVEIAGWMRNSNGKNTLVARQITAGERQVVIRNERGILVSAAATSSKKTQRGAAAVEGGAR